MAWCKTAFTAKGRRCTLPAELKSPATPASRSKIFSLPPIRLFPMASSVAGAVQGVFQRIFSNPYETAKIERVTLRMEALPERRQTTIEGAWLDKSEAEPGDTVNVKVQMRPYRGSPVIRDVQITIPPQAVRGTSMQILASDSATLNRMSIVSGSQARPAEPRTADIGVEPRAAKQPAVRHAARAFADHGGAGQSDAQRARVANQSSRPARRPGQFTGRAAIGGWRMVRAARSGRSGIHIRYDSNQVGGWLARGAGLLRSLMRIVFSNGCERRGARTSTCVRALADPRDCHCRLPPRRRWPSTRAGGGNSFEDFDKGTAKGVALRSDGKLFLAPRFAEFADANLAYLLAIRADSKGNLYAAGGSNAKVLRLDAARQNDDRV